MSVIDIRRSVRTYDTSKTIKREDLITILKKGMLAPSACGKHPWEFILLEKANDSKTMLELAKLSKILEGADSAVIVLGNKDLGITTYFDQDLGACTQNILLAATELQIGSVWIGLSEKNNGKEIVKQLFNYPSNIEAFAIIALGYPKTSDMLKEVDRFDASLIHIGKW